MILFLWFL